MREKTDLMDNVVNLAKRRGFVFPGSEIYGGLANSWDYGPLGVELKNNIKKLWWKMFVQEREDVVGVDGAVIMNPRVWEASGHLKEFSDPLVECKKCHMRYRADQLGDKCENCGSKDFTQARQFNMMFKTNLGPVEHTPPIPPFKGGEREGVFLGGGVVYLRPETAQTMFTDFKQILETSRMKLPFGVAQIGRSFRNEITPGNFIFRTREFEIMEIEYFIHEKDWKKQFEHWLAEQKKWIKACGIDEKKVEYVEIPDGERAHYSKRTVDTEFRYPFGQKELYGLAYRTDFDLRNHEQASGKNLKYKDPVSSEEFLPHVIEPTWGVERTVLAVLLSAYEEVKGGRTTTTEAVKEEEIVLRLPKELAPVKIAVLPLSRKEELIKPSVKILHDLQQHWMCQYDETGSIGKRYRRQDEIGTPFCVTVDFDSLEDKKVTVRDRDTMKQDRIKIAELVDYFKDKYA
ncbi:MAG: glycine--tRNA ligase [Candidatus Doudnabacteria bacterium]|nr:glycine--tRNA ligase [Candidatus Doudnabacteria bacterium]